MAESKSEAAPLPAGAVVLLSGGIDSSVLLHHVALELQIPRVIALSVLYGQRHARELAAAQQQAEVVGVVYNVLDLSVLGRVLQPGSALISGGAEVPELAALPEAERDQPPTYVPNRNMVLLSVAAAYAEAQGAEEVYYGAQAQDEYGYWDCTTDFLERVNAVLALNRRRPVRVRAPFMQESKAAVVARGLRLGVDFRRTWSCYRGEDLACGVCPTCVERLKAFAANGAEDPLPYA